MMKPVVLALEQQFQGITFCSVDVDAFQSIARLYSVSSMPTYKLFQSGRVLGSVVGADKTALEALLSPKSNASNDSGLLNQFITKPQLDCLNSKSGFGIANLFDNGALHSDADEQLIISIPFSQPVRLSAIKFSASANGPKVLKTFVNQSSTLSFDEAESMIPVETLLLTPQDLLPDAAPKSLFFVKYQRVYNLTVLSLNLDLCRQ
jgi:hypothetical protein